MANSSEESAGLQREKLKSLNKSVMITFKEIEIAPEYAKKWNIHPQDRCYMFMYKDGELSSSTLYRLLKKLGLSDVCYGKWSRI